jgi:hypothetical protein
VAKKFVIGVGRLDTEELHNALDRLGARGEGRSNVVMVRLTDDALARVDQLVEATLVNSRSEAAAVLIGAGIESQKELFERLSSHTDEIRKLKEQLRKVALDALRPATDK